MSKTLSARGLILPNEDKSATLYQLVGTPIVGPQGAAFPRVAFAAGHIVADAAAVYDPWHKSPVDWDRTIAFREYLWGLGLGIAEAMDTAQRGMGFGWSDALELIRRTSAAAGPGQAVVSGAGTDHLPAEDARTLDDVIRAYEEQISAVEDAGSRIVLMASRALARIARGPDDYISVYGRLLAQVQQPVVLHWLGQMFDPALAGYWGHSDLDDALEVVRAIIAQNAGKVDGIKVSLLNAAYEIKLRRQLPPTVKMYTGDDFNYVELIAGDGYHHSHALLGAFDCIAPVASAALERLGANDPEGYRAILKPTEAFSRHLFAAPTQYYKTGVVFMAYLNGHQDHFAMVGGLESARCAVHLAQLFRLADQNGLLQDPDLALRRMRAFMLVRGVEQ